MKGKSLAPLLMIFFLVSVMLHARQARDRWLASFRLAQVESLVIRLQAEGHLTNAASQRGIQRALDKGLELLRDAEGLDPAEVEIPIAEGIIYSLLGRPQAAKRAYERAMELEPRPEIFANLGRVKLDEGDREGAIQSFQKAVALDHTQMRQLRPYLPKESRVGKKEKPGRKKPRENKKRRRKKKKRAMALREVEKVWEPVFSDSFETGDTSGWTDSSKD